MNNVGVYKRLIDQGVATFNADGGTYSLVIDMTEEEAASLGTLLTADKDSLAEIDSAEAQAERAAKIAALDTIAAQCPEPVAPE